MGGAFETGGRCPGACLCGAQKDRMPWRGLRLVPRVAETKGGPFVHLKPSWIKILEEAGCQSAAVIRFNPESLRPYAGGGAIRSPHTGHSIRSKSMRLTLCGRNHLRISGIAHQATPAPFKINLRERGMIREQPHLLYLWPAFAALASSAASFNSRFTSDKRSLAFCACPCISYRLSFCATKT
jgi:hypothetical protein